jgi:hypothetical protein
MYRVKKIEHLLKIIIPIFDENMLLTENKVKRYLNFRESLINKIIESKKSTEDQKRIARKYKERNMKEIYNNETLNKVNIDYIKN